MSFLVYVVLVLIAAAAMFMLLNLLEAIAHIGIVLFIVLAIASYDGTSHYLKARGVYGELKVGQYLEAVMDKRAFNVTEEIRRQYGNAKRQGLIPDPAQLERGARDALRDLQN